MLPRHAFDDRRRNPSGFALVIALSLMAFILLLVLSISTLIEVETRSAQINLHTLKARESARLALNLAIGQLQEHAGHDQRITARAELLGDDNIHSSTRFWTGVWDATDMDKAPVWLVSGTDPDPGGKTITSSMQLVGPGTVGNNPEQYVRVPTIETLNTDGNLSSRIGWWISDEGSKASIASLPLNQRPTPNFLNANSSLQLQLATTHGLEAIFDEYDRFQSDDAQLLGRINNIKQLNHIADFQQSDPDILEDALFHSLTLNSYGVLASTADGGLMQDLSLFPGLLGTGLRNYLQLGETHANQLAAKELLLAKKLLFTDIAAPKNINTLQDGDIVTPVIPVLSNFMIAFTIRSKEKPADTDNFLLRARFFCEFWNPFTHTLLMTNNEGDPIHLELEITGFPEVTVHGREETETNGVETIVLHKSNPINLQQVMADPKNSNDAVVIRLLNGDREPWFPGRSKNWVGLENNASDPIHSPYESVLTDSKRWRLNDNTLGGIESKGEPGGIDTKEKHFKGDIYTSSSSHTLRIKVYKVTNDSRELISDLDNIEYERVDTSHNPLKNDHSEMTFGYHLMLREPYHSNLESEFFRGLWLKDHDPRSPVPLFRDDWHLSNDAEANTGSPYIPVVDGKRPIQTPSPHEINEKKSTINLVEHKRLLDRSKDSGISLDDLWQDAPLFELPHRRVLSLASLQHIYMHNERPFQVGNSWGNEGKYKTLSWFDRYYFSGFSRKDEIDNFNPTAGPPNPCLRIVAIDNFLDRFRSWKEDSESNSAAARKPAQHLLVENRFNINSTSVDAWKAVLSSVRINDFDHLNWPDKDTSELDTLELNKASRKKGSFTRFSHSLEETYQATTAPKRLAAAPSAFYRHGARRFSEEDFESFALEIVSLIKEKGRPFESMEAFLSELSPGNGSLLEQAIKKVFTHPSTRHQQWLHDWETAGKTIEDEPPVDIDHFAPGFLTQADIMTAIGPMLAPRSDTFKIRARGECFDKFGEKIGSATIEAVLQRIPEATNPSTPLNQPTDRKWKITSTRWLRENQL